MMAIKADLYSEHKGRESSVGSSARKGWRGGGKFPGQKGKLGTIEEGPQPNSVATVAEKKKLQDLKKSSRVEAKKLRKMK